ncbi:hypothetical protein [Streptomyces sp. NPDC059949]|uniref:hypothetical protein n=1 Tax=Streptomyces sp. NPDC059949 TaxID=3347013 RepID=UPI00366A14A6
MRSRSGRTGRGLPRRSGHSIREPGSPRTAAQGRSGTLRDAQGQSPGTYPAGRPRPGERAPQQYRDAINGQQSEGKNAFTIRAEFLTPELDSALTQWGSDNQKDPVFRYNAVPTIDYTALTAGTTVEEHEKVIVTMKFEDGTTKEVWYQVRLGNDYRIDSLQDPTA